MLQRLKFLALLFTCALASAQTVNNTLSPLPNYVQQTAAADAFRISAGGKTAPIYVDPADWKGVIRAANDMGDDIRKVTGTRITNCAK